MAVVSEIKERAPGDAPNRRVLFAQSDPAACELFERLGERSGWRCDVVADAASMLRALEGGRYDILISDLVIPEMSPLELLRKLKGSDSAVGGQHVIVVAPREGLREAHEFLRDGASDVVESPINIEALGRAVARVFEGLDEGDVGPWAYRFVSAERGVWEIRSSELAAAGKFPLYIGDRLYRAGRIDRETKVRLDVAFQEALMNALEHGNLELDSAWREEYDGAGVDRYSIEKTRRLGDEKFKDRKIFIETTLEGARLSIRIRDEGKGFDFEEKPRQTNEALCSGRGLAIIKWSVDEVQFAHRGTEITLTKFLPS